MAATVPPELRDLLKRYDEPVRALALAVRAVVHRELAPCREYVYDMRSKVVLIYSASERVIADGICQVPIFATHVTLVFPQGGDMDDPAHLLRGRGRIMRHVRIDDVADAEQRAVRRLLRAARRVAGLERRKRGELPVVLTTFKPAAHAPPRRPRNTAAWPDRLF